MAEIPKIATYQEMADYLKLSKKTIYGIVSRREFIPNLYIGHGRFNFSLLIQCIEKGEPFTRKIKYRI